MGSNVDPVWTERPDTVSRQNPLGVTTTRNRRLLNELVFPLSSDAITYRFRYLSYWAWVLSHTDNPNKETRARYEKIFFLANIAHVCPEDGHSSNGIVGAGRSIKDGYLADKYTPEADSFDLTASDFSLTSSDGSGFDTYYHSLMQQLWLIHGKMDLTPIGRQLAAAYDDVVTPDFAEIRAAVQSGDVSQELVQMLAESGCCCGLRDSTAERRLILHAFLANFEETADPTELTIQEELDDNALALETWYPDYLISSATTELDLEILDESSEMTDLAEYFQHRLGERARATILLFLATTERVQRLPVQTGWDVPAVDDIRTAWEFFVHTHYFVIGSEALLKAWLHGVRASEPVATDELLEQIFESALYRATLKSLLNEDPSITADSSSPAHLWRSFDAIYYGTWLDGELAVSHDIPIGDTDQAASSQNWNELVASLPPEVPEGTTNISSVSARALHELIQTDHSSASDMVQARYIAGLATVLLAQLYRRGRIYTAEDGYVPYRQWFDKIAADPSPYLLWQTPYETSNSVEEFMQTYMREQIVQKYQAVTRRKIRDRPSQTPLHMRRRPDNLWEFKSMYKTSHLFQSWSRMERLVDVLYELNLTSTAAVSDFQPTDDGLQLLAEYGVEL